MRLRLAWDALLLSLLAVPRAAEAGDAAAGQAKAAATCIVCHGPDGISKVPDAPHLAAGFLVAAIDFLFHAQQFTAHAARTSSPFGVAR